MKIYNEIIAEIKGEKLFQILNNYRKIRNFDPEIYLNKKIEVLSRYFKEHKLNAVVLAVSGGVDSALVLAMMKKFAEKQPDVLKKIYPITLPAENNSGVSGQSELVSRVNDLSVALDIKIEKYDLSVISDQVNNDTEKMLNVKINNWAKGQFVPYLRTSYLYYLTNILNQEGFRSVLMGTINADEGQYLGYIGKASDAMVDIQPISDLHKREVFILAKYLGVPDSILNVDPKGDMYDERTDEEVFGANYDAVEFYYAFMKLPAGTQSVIKYGFTEEESASFFQIKENLDKMHSYNLHKYIGCSPSVHFDIYDMKIPGGWKYTNLSY